MNQGFLDHALEIKIVISTNIAYKAMQEVDWVQTDGFIL